jgi:hypothetical protein
MARTLRKSIARAFTPAVADKYPVKLFSHATVMSWNVKFSISVNFAILRSVVSYISLVRGLLILLLNVVL